MNEQQAEMGPTLAGVSAIENGRSMQQVRTAFTTAISVQKPRKLPEVESHLMAEADQAGENFYYGWGAGKDRVEGPSVGLALAAARCYGNCAVDLLPVQETIDAWVFTASFVDLETGFTLTRQFRQSKSWTVYGKFDAARKDDIRFQIGQSKAIRNVVMNAIPEWLVRKAMDRSKGGVREKIEKLIAEQGASTVIEKAMGRLAEHGVDEEQMLAKFGRPTVRGLTIEDLVLIRGDLSALESGQDTVANLYPQAPAKQQDEQTGGATTDDLLSPRPASKGGPKRMAGSKHQGAAESTGSKEHDLNQG
jgi:hypothetical protein